MIVELLKKSMFFILIGAGIIIFFFIGNDDSKGSTDSPSNFTSTIDTQKTAPQNDEKDEGYAIVDVKGEILKPGVYEISSDSRVNDVIKMAGGFTEQADQTMVNLAQKVQDEMIILIPKIGEIESNTSEGQNTSKKIRLNYATQEEIESLNGIGPSKAQAILQYREENGLFQTADDLLNVPGIGAKTLENLKEDIQVP
ncbi:helix-hairpin-helix domain-containing protein [Virgibacillus oceani]|uniref:Competence protein ComEA n=1 Tax=Virgibacillus oceani TaxID=1479511 RepID=A0A917H034_9BACI|nr:helix-hairpin-helix domain-containing protein [Virgibacillus oceani]GGG63184.1 competence protein ComEA [Virgibacillus oceani]